MALINRDGYLFPYTNDPFLLDGDDYIIVGRNDQPIYSFTGNDRIDGSDTSDTVYGGEGSDRISGDLGDDWLWGGDNGPTAHPEDSDDFIDGGDGDDHISDGHGNNTLRVGPEMTWCPGAATATLSTVTLGTIDSSPRRVMTWFMGAVALIVSREATATTRSLAMLARTLCWAALAMTR